MHGMHEALRFEVRQRGAQRETGDTQRLGELALGRQALSHGVVPEENLRAEFMRDRARIGSGMTSHKKW